MRVMFSKVCTAMLVASALVAAGAAQAQIAVKNHRQILQSLSLVTGIPLSDQDIQATYTETRSRLPREGTLDEISSPMLLANTALAGMFCKKMIERDSALPSDQRTILRDFDFSDRTVRFPRVQRLAVINDFAGVFWQRGASDGEAEVLLETFGYANEQLALTKAERMSTLVTGCTAIASSISSLLY
jgi:hypothetical protein